MNISACRWGFAAAFGGFFAGRMPAQNVAQEPAIELPIYTVTDSRALPPPEKWLYARIDGFEVLSNASARTTKGLVSNLQRFTFALDAVWPVAHRQSANPVALIICGRGGKFDAFAPAGQSYSDMAMASIRLRSREVSAIVVDTEARVLNLNTPETLASGGDNPGVEVDAYQQLDREYVHFLLDDAQLALPPWFIEGLSQIFMKMEMTHTTITVGKIEDPNLVSAGQAMGGESGPDWDRDFNGALKNRRLMPMAEMFAMSADAPEARNPIGSTWAKQCYAFVHWCLYGENDRHQKEFIAFMTRLQREPLTEALFQECFKMNYRQMAVAIRSYIGFTDYKSPEFRAKKGQKIPEPPPFELRDATQAEIGRITGDALHLAGRDDAAHLALIAPYIRGERDPQLLAAIGVQEHAMGDDTRARKFLEAAAREKAVRPDAYLVLARLRLIEELAQPGAGENLNAAQASAVLKPLFTARSQPPPLPEVYETIADVWGRTSVSPQPENLAVLDEGVRFFPRDAALIYRDAELKAKIGLRAEATMLVNLGLNGAPDPAMREKFQSLKAALPPPSLPLPSSLPLPPSLPAPTIPAVDK